jgi:hypothetical protein
VVCFVFFLFIDKHDNIYKGVRRVVFLCSTFGLDGLVFICGAYFYGGVTNLSYIKEREETKNSKINMKREYNKLRGRVLPEKYLCKIYLIQHPNKKKRSYSKKQFEL